LLAQTPGHAFTVENLSVVGDSLDAENYRANFMLLLFARAIEGLCVYAHPGSKKIILSVLIVQRQ